MIDEQSSTVRSPNFFSPKSWSLQKPRRGTNQVVASCKLQGVWGWLCDAPPRRPGPSPTGAAAVLGEGGATTRSTRAAALVVRGGERGDGARQGLGLGLAERRRRRGRAEQAAAACGERGFFLSNRGEGEMGGQRGVGDVCVVQVFFVFIGNEENTPGSSLSSFLFLPSHQVVPPGESSFVPLPSVRRPIGDGRFGISFGSCLGVGLVLVCSRNVVRSVPTSSPGIKFSEPRP